MALPEFCPLCKTPVYEYTHYDDLEYSLTCDTCGEFRMVFVQLTECSKSPLQNLYLFQGVIREKNLDHIIPFVDPFAPLPKNFLFESVLLPQTALDKMDKLLLSISHTSEVNYGAEFGLRCKEDAPLAYARDLQEFRYLLKAMAEMGYFMESKETAGEWRLVLSTKAWTRIDELLRGGLGSKQIFVACSFDDQHDHYRYAIEAGIQDAGYLAMSIKEKDYPGTILAQALGQIRKSRFVVVDLTEQRNSVFVEWGFAMGLGLNFILFAEAEYWERLRAEKKESLEFYSKNYKIRRYKEDAELTKLVSTAIGEIIGYGHANLPARSL